MHAQASLVAYGPAQFQHRYRLDDLLQPGATGAHYLDGSTITPLPSSSLSITLPCRVA